MARESAAPTRAKDPEALAKQANAAMAYARTLPDVADISADPLGHRLTVRFKSGWRAVAPIEDGKSGAETLGKPAPGSRTPRARRRHETHALSCLEATTIYRSPHPWRAFLPAAR